MVIRNLRNSEHERNETVTYMYIFVNIFFVYGLKSIFWLNLHTYAFIGNKVYSYTECKNDGSKHWSICHRENLFKFIPWII